MGGGTGSAESAGARMGWSSAGLGLGSVGADGITAVVSSGLLVRRVEGTRANTG